ncbi:MAG: DNA replication/repair protein RecF [Deltaproteobacteria bacterium]|nr:DNA replication/repair protein RecF [Deltaproteobacteria bacterium]
MERVQLDTLSLGDFRNIRRAEIQPGSRFNIFGGDNGMGKTNVVEAIYLLGTLRSFRTSVRGEMIRHGCESARVEGLFVGAAAGIRCEITLTENERRLRVDSKSRRPDGSHFRSLPMVLFHPGNLDLVQGGPQARRRLLDRALFQAEGAYPDVLSDYNRALRSRNRLLKDRPLDRRALEPFDRQLAELGARVCGHRRQIVSLLEPLFLEAFEEVSGTSRSGLTYRPSVEGDGEEFAATLGESLKSDIDRGFTARGPHADDLEVLVDDRAARRFASQGQQRAAALSLKIAETRALARVTERIPLLLLDDVSSELDEIRNARLFDFLAGVGGQVLITTTNLDTIRVHEDRTDFSVIDGAISRVTDDR